LEIFIGRKSEFLTSQMKGFSSEQGAVSKELVPPVVPLLKETVTQSSAGVGSSAAHETSALMKSLPSEHHL